MENYEPIIQARIARMRIVMATSDSARAIERTAAQAIKKIPKP